MGKEIFSFSFSFSFCLFVSFFSKSDSIRFNRGMYYTPAAGHLIKLSHPRFSGLSLRMNLGHRVAVNNREGKR